MRQTLAVILLFAVGSANAYNVVYSAPGEVTGIGNLEIGGTLYNVDFETGVYSTFGGVEDFWTTSSESFAAATAIVDVLNAEGDPVVNNASVDGYVFGDPVLFTVANAVDTGSGGVFFYAPDDWTATACCVGPIYRTAWSVAAVPVPAAVWLFASGLGLLGWIKKESAPN